MSDTSEELQYVVYGPQWGIWGPYDFDTATYVCEHRPDYPACGVVLLQRPAGAVPG